MNKYADTHQMDLAQLQKQLDAALAERDQLAQQLSSRAHQDKADVPPSGHGTSLHEWLKVIDAITDPIFVHDRQFRIVLANQAYAKLANTSLDKVRGRLYWELFPRQAGPMASCVKALSLQSEQHEEILLDNAEVYISRSFPIRDANNKYLSSVHVLHNITEQRRLEEQSHIQDEALQHSAEAVLIVDDRLNISYANPAFCKLFGYDRDDILGQPLTLVDDTDDNSRPSDRQIIDYIRENDATWSGKVLVKPSSGTSFWVHHSASAIKDSQDNIIGFVKNYLDLRAVTRANQQVESLHAVIEDLSTRLDLDAVGSAAISSAVKLLESDTGFICLVDEADGKVYHHWHVGLPEEDVSRLRGPYEPDQGLTSQVLASGKSRVIKDYAQNEKHISDYIRLGVKSVAGVPIIIDDRVEGVMFVASLQRTLNYSSEQISFLEAIARQMGVGLQRKRLIAELEDSRKYLNHIIDTVPDIIYQGLPENFSTPFVSRAVTEILGYEAEEFMNNPRLWQQVVHEDDAERVFGSMREVFSSAESSFNIEYRIRHKDGKSWRWIEDRGAIERDEQGQPIKIFGAASDITERKQFQQKLEDSQARYSDLFNNIKSGVAVYRAIDDGRDFIFADFNRGAEKIEKINREDVINRSLFEIFPVAKDIGFIDALKRIWKTGEPESFPVFFYNDGRIEGWRDNTLYRLKTGEVVAVYDDITERKRAEVSLDRVNRALKTLSNCNQTLVHARTEQDLLDDICRGICENGGYPMSCVCYIEQDKHPISLKPVSHYGFAGNYVNSLSRHWRQDVSKQTSTMSPEISAITSKKPFIVHRIPFEKSELPWVKIAQAYDCCSLICMPIINSGHVIGALTILAREPSAFDDDEVMLLNELATDLGYGITTLRSHEERKDLAQREHFSNQRLQDSLVSTIQAIATSMEKRDPYTAGHQRNVAKLATAIAREMGLPEEQINGLQLGALIHDIGKIYVPAEILNRPGKLTTAEFEIIKSHPEVGYEIIQGVEFPWPVNEMVLQHHERLNGSGYPRGLMGDQIALEARILAVADVVEALASHRPYRPGLGIDAALREVDSHRGTLYESEVVDKCIQLFKNKQFAFEKQHDV